MQAENPLDRDLWLFHIAFRQLVKFPDRILKAHGLGRVHNRIMFVIARSGEIPVGDIAERLEITRQAIHGPMRQLRAAGLIESHANPANRSVQMVRLTPKGESLEFELNEVQRKHLQEAFDAAGAAGAKGWREVMLHIGLNPRTSS